MARAERYPKTYCPSFFMKTIWVHISRSDDGVLEGYLDGKSKKFALREKGHGERILSLYSWITFLTWGSSHFPFSIATVITECYSLISAHEVINPIVGLPVSIHRDDSLRCRWSISRALCGLMYCSVSAIYRSGSAPPSGRRRSHHWAVHRGAWR